MLEILQHVLGKLKLLQVAVWVVPGKPEILSISKTVTCKVLFFHQFYGCKYLHYPLKKTERKSKDITRQERHEGREEESKTEEKNKKHTRMSERKKKEQRERRRKKERKHVPVGIASYHCQVRIVGRQHLAAIANRGSTRTTRPPPSLLFLQNKCTQASQENTRTCKGIRSLHYFTGLPCVHNLDNFHHLRADAVPPTPKKRGRRRLTALEVLQAKSAFCRSQRIFLRLACSWERFEGSAEATKGAPVPPIGGLTALRIPSKKGKAGVGGYRISIFQHVSAIMTFHGMSSCS